MTLIEQAMKKFPAAKERAVVNFTMGVSELNYESYNNLAYDAKCYKWNTATVNAIKWVLNQKSKVKA